MPFSGLGAGTVADPYQITTLTQLQEYTSYLTSAFKLMNDIDASASATMNGTGTPPVYAGFAPSGTVFQGSFDGNNKTISNLYIYRPGTQKIGLFGIVGGSSLTDVYIKNLTLTNINFTGDGSTGGMVGTVVNATLANRIFSNCSVSGVINGKDSTASNIGGVGGFVGRSGVAIYQNCSADVVITMNRNSSSTTSAGGFVGLGVTNTLNSTYTDCVASGGIEITFTNISSLAIAVGGFHGYESAGTFTRCIASGNIVVNSVTTSATTNYIGGFGGNGLSGYSATGCSSGGNVSWLSLSQCAAGGFTGSYSGSTLTKCVSKGSVTNLGSSSSYSGGFVGYSSSSVGFGISNCFCSGDVCLGTINQITMPVGGFVGTANQGTTTNCYSISLVNTTLDSAYTGGFCGTKNTGVVSNCYWDIETSGWTTSILGEGKSTTQMKTISTFVNWDFVAVWLMPSFIRSNGTGLTIYLSKSGDYENFEEGIKDADSFSLELPSTNKIAWVEAVEALLIGTAGDEWRISSSKLDNPLTPTNYSLKEQSLYGSKYLQPIKVNNAVLFVDFVGRKIREMTYSSDQSKYLSPDLTALAEHITNGGGVINVARQKNPDSIIWCVLADGTLISMVYERDQNVIAWSKHPINGFVQSVCVVPDVSEDYIWLSVGRTTSDTLLYESDTVLYEIDQVFYNVDTDVTHIERMNTRTLPTVAQDSIYLDASVVYDGVSTSTITGLDHLEGNTVSVLADGLVQTDKIVTEGQITLDTAASVVVVGLASTYKLQPMRMDTQTRDGSSVGSKAKITTIYVNFLNTLGAEYGSPTTSLYSDTTLQTYPFDFEQAQLTTTPTLHTGSLKTVSNVGFSEEDAIIITGSQPLPCTVRSIVVQKEVV